jgi:hypothetical protein
MLQYLRCKAKIANFDVHLAGEHDVGEGEVPVHDPVGVQVQQTRHNLQRTVQHWLQNGMKSPPVLRYGTC